MTESTTRDSAEMFYKDWGAGQLIVRSHGATGASDSHVTGCAWTVHPIGAR
jgi:hypothetical protein